MKHEKLSLLLAVLAVATSSAASAQVRINVGIDPFGFGGYRPPVVYAPPVYYAPPPVVYLGGGSWGDGDHRRGHQRRGRHR